MTVPTKVPDKTGKTDAATLGRWAELVPDPHPMANCGPLQMQLAPGMACPTCGTTPPDPTGLNFSRDDLADDPTPVSPARVPLHVAIREDDGAELVEVAPDEPLHMQFLSGDTSCGLTPGEYRDGSGTANQAAVTCKACIDGMPF